VEKKRTGVIGFNKQKTAKQWTESREKTVGWEKELPKKNAMKSWSLNIKAKGLLWEEGFNLGGKKSTFFGGKQGATPGKPASWSLVYMTHNGGREINAFQRRMHHKKTSPKTPNPGGDISMKHGE